MEYLKQTLGNGLQIVAECNDAAYSTALGFFVNTGARDENDAIAGVSHFLEHMVFKGTPGRSADDVNREFDEMGAHYNAFTNEENTVFYAAVLPEHQRQAVELLADILRPSLRQDDFDTEKQVILEEIQMYEDQPPFGADDKGRAMHFGSHPLGRSVLGTAASVGNLSREAMDEYFRRQYSPGNIVLAAAGQIDFAELVACAGAAAASGSRPPRAEPSSRRHRATAFSSCRRNRPRSNTCCKSPPAPPPKIATATPPNCWPPCWATTPAAGSTGNCSIPAWSSTSASATASTRGRA